MPSTRRRLLAATGALGATALAGCTGPCSDVPFLGPDMPHDGVVAASPVGSVPDDADVVALANLPSAERALVRQAIDGGAVRACMDDETERTRAMESFADRVAVESYLADGDDDYALWVRLTDVVYAGTADSPDGNPDPCCE